MAFDLGNVLIHFDHAIAARRLSELSGLDLARLVTRFKESGLGELFDEGKLTAREFAEQLMKRVGFQLDFNVFCAAWNDIFWENPGMESLLKELKGRFPLYVVSDTNEMHFRFIQERFSIVRWVDRFILSYEVGVRKPDPKIFGEVLRHSGREADQVVFIDDRTEVVREAEAFGFHAVQFRSLDQLKDRLRDVGVEVCGET